MVPSEFRKGHHHHPTLTKSLSSVHHSNPSCWGHSASQVLEYIWSTCLLIFLEDAQRNLCKLFYLFSKRMIGIQQYSIWYIISKNWSMMHRSRKHLLWEEKIYILVFLGIDILLCNIVPFHQLMHTSLVAVTIFSVVGILFFKEGLKSC